MERLGDRALRGLLEGLNHAEECFESTGAAVRLRTLGDFAANHRRTQGPLGAVVGRLHLRVVQDAQQMTTILLRVELSQDGVALSSRANPPA